ncbi:hypothetical protein [Paenibacillus campinasensis]|uniref:Uncharacterized protein n=1 Tax=Paenibacillus campinasensis TaxID=66347 RepID=A0A268EGX8_9BACL|nr:hypothetical protein [Paenibacillus campinasensis]PAD72395.1 hypothetical protein CHH67_22400 [Paenibacillus campinasensis]
MDVLNTTGGGFSVVAIIGAVIFLGLVILSGWGLTDSIRDRERISTIVFAFGVVWFTILFLGSVMTRDPIRHEVTLRPGHVIDATKYEIVEQRGQIYVIEEREAAE